MTDREILIHADELKDQLDDENLVIIDGSWHLPNANRDAQSEFESGHIQGAQFFNIDLIADQNSGLPHTIPSPETFATAVEEMGISNNSNIVVYDTSGMFSAARVWWMLKKYGAENVRILDGGLPAWKMAGHNVTDKKRSPSLGKFVPNFAATSVVPLAEMREIVGSNNIQVLDARGSGRFKGEEPEPREGMRAGHMPGAINVPFSELLRDDGTFKSPTDLRSYFAAREIDLDQPTVTTCGSGVTAAIILVALALAGKTDTRLYDGSWAEWGSLKDTPIETG